ncbi:hypothetical protein [Actinotalea sp. Marseille-Q4924]|uniref:hypothetical protein n=1 Tax=Actinotalea sp. Marseille-Q4924 TaxID=2866571 RepID=UPI001CE49049|nr:hypothetical protein [Actinotalea sp. Marseille-Q4924]
MNRATYALDRVVLTLIALVLLLGGAWVVAWSQGWLPDGWWSPRGFFVGPVPESLTGADWWPVALLVGGAVLTVLGLVWLVRHFRSHGVEALSLVGDPHGGSMIVQGAALASGAAAVLQDSGPDVTRARGSLAERHGRLVVDLTASVRRDADLEKVARLCDRVADEVVRTTGRSDVSCRVRLKVAPRAGRAPRVH